MSRSPLALAALATIAVPGLEAVGVNRVESSTDFDVARVVDVSGRAWTVKAPRAIMTGAAMEGEVALLESLAVEDDRKRLPFDVPRPSGFAALPEGGRAMVFPELAGLPLNVTRLTPIAPAVAAAIAAIHSLPTEVLTTTGLPTYSASEYRERRLTELDEGASTGKVPSALLQRWESACEDVRLWQFVPTIVHGDLAPEHILIEEQEVVGVIEWASAQVGDPADDLAPLLAQAPERAVDVLVASYRAARGVEDEHLLPRIVLSSEMAVLRWLMHGVRTQDEGVIEDAVGMLGELADLTAGAEPIEEIGRPAPEGEEPIRSSAAPGSGVVPLEDDAEGVEADGVEADDDQPTTEIRRSDLM